MGLAISEPDRPAEEGATATEYVLLLVLIALAITAGVIAYGTQLGGLFVDAGSQVQTAVDGSS